MMSEPEFWKIIDQSRAQVDREEATTGDAFLTLEERELKRLLNALPPDRIIDFQSRFDDLRQRAYRWDLWGAAYWLGGGCGNDGFLDFRSCLVSLGREMFERVLADPDTLAEISDRPDVPYLQSEGFQYIAGEIYRAKTGRNLVDDLPETPPAGKPTGKKFDFEDEALMAERYPKIVEKYPDMGG